MMNYKWQVMKLCNKQLRDINTSDILDNGLYRKCNTYKGGGGYDKFPEIYNKRIGITQDVNQQFVVQLKGCPLSCPYCYVTPDGVHNGECVEISTDKLVSDFLKSNLTVLHLMGGAPAIYINHWCDIIESIGENQVFHSDLLLIEGEYNDDIIKKLSLQRNSLYAVSIKGSTPEEFFNNTNTSLKQELMWNNLDKLVKYDFPYYLTFTGMSENSINNFKNNVFNRYGHRAEDILKDSFSIDLIEYEALK